MEKLVIVDVEKALDDNEQRFVKALRDKQIESSRIANAGIIT